MADLRALLDSADLPWVAERQDHHGCGHSPSPRAWLLKSATRGAIAGVQTDRIQTDAPDRMVVAVAAVNALPALLDCADALRFHNKTPNGATRTCLDGCIACAALAHLEAPR